MTSIHTLYYIRCLSPIAFHPGSRKCSKCNWKNFCMNFYLWTFSDFSFLHVNFIRFNSTLFYIFCLGRNFLSLKNSFYATQLTFLYHANVYVLLFLYTLMLPLWISSSLSQHNIHSREQNSMNIERERRKNEFSSNFPLALVYMCTPIYEWKWRKRKTWFE